MGFDAATLAALQRCCADAAVDAPAALPALLAVCTAALLGVDESYVGEEELRKAHRRLAPSLQGVDNKQQLDDAARGAPVPR